MPAVPTVNVESVPVNSRRKHAPSAGVIVPPGLTSVQLAPKLSVAAGLSPSRAAAVAAVAGRNTTVFHGSTYASGLPTACATNR